MAATLGSVLDDHLHYIQHLGRDAVSFVDTPTLELLYEIQADLGMIDPLTTDPDLLAVQLVKVRNKLTSAIDYCEGKRS